MGWDCVPDDMGKVLAIGSFFHIAGTVTRLPALGGFGAAMIVKDDVTNPTKYDRDTFAIQRRRGPVCIKPTGRKPVLLIKASGSLQI